MKERMNILIVLTSHDQLGDTGHATGFWVEEFAAPYYAFKDAGFAITLASPKGGPAPIDPSSEKPEYETEATRRYREDQEVQNLIAHTKPLSEVSADSFDAVFYPGGHGPLWDLTNNPDSIKLIQQFWKAKKPVAAVCHAPAVLINVVDENGEPLVKGKNVTGFTNTEEEAVQLTKVVPFLLEDELKNKGGNYSKGADWAPHVVRDGLLITGQNPASSEGAAHELIELLKGKEK